MLKILSLGLVLIFFYACDKKEVNNNIKKGVKKTHEIDKEINDFYQRQKDKKPFNDYFEKKAKSFNKKYNKILNSDK